HQLLRMDFVLTKHRLGAGCFGEVRLAHCGKLTCAAKLTHLTTSDYDKEKLQQEISILKHPHVVLFLGDVMYNGKLAIVMEYVAKGSLQDTIRNRPLSGWLEKKRIMQDITLGVAYIHSQKILHRDLKSGNVLLDHSMRANMCDFGLSVADKLFDWLKISPMDLSRFVLPRSYLRWEASSMPVAKDDMSETYEGQISSHMRGCACWYNVVMPRTRHEDGSVVYIPKLTGFKACCYVERDSPATKRVVWHAPELESRQRTASFKTDVFSFELPMFEISMGSPPPTKDPGFSLVFFMSSVGELVLGPRLGVGGFAEVFLASWMRQPCAVKRVYLTLSEYNQATLKNEIDIFRELRHKNIIQFYRETYFEGSLVMIMDIAENGSLSKLIQSNPNGFHIADKKRIAQEITRGLAYMHDLGVLHRDLKSDNVLLDEHMVVKLCDFGLATIKAGAAAESSGAVHVGTDRWRAPELFFEKPEYTTKSDMYALGWIMWEMAADKTPPFREHPDNSTVISLVKGGQREAIPASTPPDYRALVERCWHQNPQERPEARALLYLDEDPTAGTPYYPIHSARVGTELSFEHVATIPSLSASFLSSSGGSITYRSSQPALEKLAATETQLKMIDLEQLSVQGNMDAQYALGMMYLSNEAAVRNDQEAIYWLKGAASQGHVQARQVLEELKSHGVLKGDLTDLNAVSTSLKLAWEASSAAGLIKDIERRQPLMQTYSKDFDGLLSQSKDVAARYPDSTEVASILREAGMLAIKLSAPGAAALIARERALGLLTTLKNRLTQVKG
ncbi:hypothetical protein DFQ26_000596, partial [Actinomortierella ambigua]